MASIVVLAPESVFPSEPARELEAAEVKIERFQSAEALVERLRGAPVHAVFCDLSRPWSELFPLLKRLRTLGAGKVFHLGMLGSVPANVPEIDLAAVGIRKENVFPVPPDASAILDVLHRSPGEFGSSEDTTPNIPPKGRLGVHPLGRVFLRIQSSSATGNLQVSLSASILRFVFIKGKLRGVEADSGPASLPNMLRNASPPIPEAHTLKEPVSFSSLIAQGILSPHLVPALMSEQARIALTSVLEARHGFFHWREGDTSGDQGIPIDLFIPRVILDAFEARDQHSEQTETIRPLPAPWQVDDIKSWRLLPFELRTLNLMDGSRTGETLVSIVGGTDEKRRRQVRGFIEALLTLGVLESARDEEPTDWDERLAALQREYERIREADHFEVLKVDRDVGMTKLRERFVALSKEYHPDRSHDAPEAVATLMGEIFRRVQDAYDVLGDPRKREDYVAELAIQEGGIDPKSILQAEIEFSRGELFLKNRNYAKALECYQKALEGAPNELEYQVMVAWSLFKTDPKRYEESARMLHAVLREKSDMDRALYYLGCIFKARNEFDKAESAFKKAVAANPEHIEAQRELRLATMRREKSGGSLKGLFGRFKKS